MSDEKDRFGEKMRDVEAAREDQWAKKRDNELLQQMREKMAASSACPHCKRALVTRTVDGVEMLACPQNDGAWVDHAALELLLKARK